MPFSTALAASACAIIPQGALTLIGELGGNARYNVRRAKCEVRKNARPFVLRTSYFVFFLCHLLPAHHRAEIFLLILEQPLIRRPQLLGRDPMGNQAIQVDAAAVESGKQPALGLVDIP